MGKKRIKKIVERERQEYILIKRDFNIRIGEEGSIEYGDKLGKKKSKDKKISNNRSFYFNRRD